MAIDYSNETLVVHQVRGKTGSVYIRSSLLTIYFLLFENSVKPIRSTCSGVFPKWKGKSMNSENLRNHWSMNWGQLKYPRGCKLNNLFKHNIYFYLPLTKVMFYTCLSVTVGVYPSMHLGREVCGQNVCC